MICTKHNESIFSCPCALQSGGEARLDPRRVAPPDLAPLKDSGERRAATTGAVRDMAQGKGSFELLPLFGLLLAALQMERGAEKYAPRNWEKGMPLSWFVNSGTRHLLKYTAGFDDEPHLDAAIWNLLCLAEGRERIRRGMWPAELDDLPKTYAGQTPGF